MHAYATHALPNCQVFWLAPHPSYVSILAGEKNKQTNKQREPPPPTHPPNQAPTHPHHKREELWLYIVLV